MNRREQAAETFSRQRGGKRATMGGWSLNGVEEYGARGRKRKRKTQRQKGAKVCDNLAAICCKTEREGGRAGVRQRTPAPVSQSVNHCYYVLRPVGGRAGHQTARPHQGPFFFPSPPFSLFYAVDGSGPAFGAGRGRDWGWRRACLMNQPRPLTPKKKKKKKTAAASRGARWVWSPRLPASDDRQASRASRASRSSSAAWPGTHPCSGTVCQEVSSKQPSNCTAMYCVGFMSLADVALDRQRRKRASSRGAHGHPGCSGRTEKEEH